ncbi:alpha/beta fold hydrolase [Mycobacterium sp. CBMA247]|nr:alpha/beta fold hydrolase [Mycolicibacterium sp. CBMA 329]MUL86009.1 alpha/beta fold hydrolase [Mycolicibacterium sp. CBMA 331]MUM00783.1 alpha/beta fold hydrolase [Mycolicibacterium sp. CBMA 334]MUM36305.1 alpha/beta fold hydrolase [Mycolicibacterium sp. CBMA 247]MUM42073.1 alpha/beta fold hydrolase [Mycolicibacterium sp. CBMA 294]
MAERMMPNASWSRFALNLARQPRTVGARAKALGHDLVKIVEGKSDIAPAKGDKRFADPAWSGNPMLKRTMQAYLAATDTVNQLYSDADLDWRDGERMRFVLDVLTEGLSPSNNPLINPLGYKALINTGGQSAVRGLRHFLGDVSSAPRVPSMVDSDAFTLGETVALTGGAVVFRTEVFELIQYTPQTAEVFEVPLLMVPPVINKFYIMDIAPGRSMIEYFVRQGHQVFAMSWRNPTAEHRNWGFDSYGQAILDALEAVEKVAVSERIHLQASCSGGILTAMTASHLTATGQADRLAGLTLMVTVLDQRKAGFAAAAIDEEMANIAIALSARKGYLDGRALAEVFAWLRPNDLVWRYWVNNYVEGKSPAAFDVLYWNADTTRMAAALHRDMVLMGLHNSLVTPGAVTMLGTPVDVSALDVDTYVVAGIADHISPWQACYRSARLLRKARENDRVRFALSSSGHIAALVNPPGNPKASHRIGGPDEADPEAWLKSAVKQPDSWWPDFAAWLADRSGNRKAAPDTLGGAGMEPMEPAPGSYVLEH